jgi:Tripartite tricarboxylate transporter TctB family
MTRWVHVTLGLLVCVIGSILFAMSLTGLDFLGPNGEPGPGFAPALFSGVLAVLGLALALMWLVRPPDPSAESAVLSLERVDLMRAGAVWLSLVGFTALIEPFGFLLAGEAFVLVLIVFVDRIRTKGLILTLLLMPPATYFLFATLLEVDLPQGTLWA